MSSADDFRGRLVGDFPDAGAEMLAIPEEREFAFLSPADFRAAFPDAPGTLPGNVVVELSPRHPAVMKPSSTPPEEAGNGALEAQRITFASATADRYIWMDTAHSTSLLNGIRLILDFAQLQGGTTYLLECAVDTRIGEFPVEGGTFRLTTFRPSSRKEFVAESGTVQVLPFLMQPAEDGTSVVILTGFDLRSWMFRACRLTRLAPLTQT